MAAARLQVPGGPLLSPRPGRTQPCPSTPPRTSGSALPFYQVPKQSLAPRGREMKSGRSELFLNTLQNCTSRKMKLSHWGERWKNTHRSMVPSSHSRSTSHQPTASPPHDPLVCLSPSSLLPPAPRHSQEGQVHACPEPRKPQVVKVRKQVSSHKVGFQFPCLKGLESIKVSKTASHS